MTSRTKSEDAKPEAGKKEAAGCCRRIGTLQLFVLNISALLLFLMIGTIYTTGIIRTLERRFGLRSSQSGFLFSCNDITHTTLVLFIGYFGRRAHKSRIISITSGFSAAAFVLMASPHWLFDSSSPAASATVGGRNESLPGGNFTTSNQRHAAFCSASEFNTTRDKSISCDVTSATVTSGQSVEPRAYYVFVAAQVLSGVGTSGINVLGLTYIDENAPQAKSSLYVGIATSMYTVAPIGGLMLSAVTLRLPENLRFSDSWKPEDPTFIGCWWLGYIVCAVVVAILIIPMWFFPKTISGRAKRGAASAVAHPLTSDEAQDKCQDQRTRIETIRKQLKEFPQSVVRLVRNKPYVVNIGGMVCYMYTIVGVFSNLVRYIEIHFNETAFVGSIIAAVGSAFAGSIGAFTGGILMSRTKMTPVGAVRLMIFASSVFATGLLVIVFLACPQVEFAGGIDPTSQTFILENDCNHHCSCTVDRRSYAPVCGSDNMTYFSACFAGCTEFVNGTFGSCSCVNGSHTSWETTKDAIAPFDKFSATARPGRCATGCKQIIPFAIVTFTISLISSMANVAWTMVIFRLVGQEERSFALACCSFAMNVFGLIPAPIIFGRLIDSSCRLWQRSASVSSISSSCRGNPTGVSSGKGGSCLLYDTSKFRLRTYGVAFGIKLIELTLAVSLYLLIRKRTFDADCVMEMELKDIQQKENGDMNGNTRMNNGAENKQLLQNNE